MVIEICCKCGKKFERKLSQLLLAKQHYCSKKCYLEITFEINKNGCHICTSHKTEKSGYCRIVKNGKRILIHRFIYEQNYGAIPEGLIVRHKCDVRNCINPGHLEIGTHKDNMRDMKERGRANYSTKNHGEKHKNHKLTELEVIAIRTDNRKQREIARDYGVCRQTIGDIKTGKLWKHLLEA